MLDSSRLTAARPVTPRRRRWTTLLVLGFLLGSCGLAACSSDTSPETGDVAGAYARIIRWFVERMPDEIEQPTVFVEARGEGMTIGLDTQAAIVQATEADADVRFIDDRSEALDDQGNVRKDALLLALGPAVPNHNEVLIDCDQIVSETLVSGRTFDLRFADGEWDLRGEPAEILP